MKITKIPVKSLEDLDKILSDNSFHDFFIHLDGPLVSRKEISRNTDGSYFIFNSIDGTTITQTKKQLMAGKKSNIYQAITENRFSHVIYD